MEVSVVIPVFNAEKWVGEAVSSVLGQDHVAEIVLVEDGSADKSLSVCERLLESTPKVRLLRHPNGENRGAGATRNLGVRAAEYDLVSFLDADDIYLPGRFPLPVKILAENPEIDGVYEAVGTIFEDEAARAKWREMGWGDLTTMRKAVNPSELFYYLIMGGAGHFHLDGFTIRKRLFSKIGGFNPLLRLHQDSDFCMKGSAVGKLVPGRLNEPVACRRVHSGNRFVRVRRDALQTGLLAWRATDEWARETRQSRGKRLIVGYRLSRVLSRYHRSERRYVRALWQLTASAVMVAGISVRRKMLGTDSF
jgi:glycosyltransferase involved in cell wall biosynthesis